MVAPKGSTKEAVELRTPRSFFTVSIVTGSVAIEEAVDSATACGFFIA
ncbi:Uncharacterised protein [Vibrio cholerae]|nr:Uncharacterised protein [Vibrio cholerae]CSB16776.1 Uncharacterised protein [Vibrio cholerae]CSC44333.1 Uncharacterised protein [Vibrio cholerae]